MSTQITFDYGYKILPKSQFKQFALELAQFCNTPNADVHIFLHHKEDGFQTSTPSTIDELDNKYDIVTSPESIAIHVKAHIIIIKLNNAPDNFHITYMLDGDLNYSKRLIFFIENTLEITRLDQGTKNPKNVDQPCIDTDTEDLNSASDNETHSLLSSNYLWHKVTLQLQLLLSDATYQTWIAPIIPNTESNHLILNCPNEFAKDWIESRYKKTILEAVQSIEPSIEDIIIRFIGKGANLSDETIKKQFDLKVNEPLFKLMTMVYERETENSIVGWTFEKYFNLAIESHCQERMRKIN